MTDAAPIGQTCILMGTTLKRNRETEFMKTCHTSMSESSKTQAININSMIYSDIA